MRVEDMLRRSAAAVPDKTALVCDGTRLSHGELDALSDRLAAGLAARGLRPGDRVVVLMENVWEAAVAVFGILKAGGVFCPVNPSAPEDSLRFVLDNTRPHGVLTQARFVARCGGAAPLIAAARATAALPEGTTPLEDLLSPSGDAAPAVGDRADLAMIIHTSGSTGVAKGAMMTHANMVFATCTIAAYLENSADDVVLSALPLSFTYGLYQLLVAVHAGATLVLHKSFAFPTEVLETARREGVTGLPLVPTMAAVLLKMKDLRPGPVPTLRYITNAAAALPSSHIEGLTALFPGVKLYSMYGLTECARATFLAPEEIGRRPGSVGKALPGTEFLIIDDSGHQVAPGETGELVIQGPHVMQGYWQDEAATRAALRPVQGRGGTWLHTGDLFCTDDEGYLHFVGRKDDMLKVRGEKVAPRQVEAVLHACPGVAEAVVIGRPDLVSGHVLHAVIVRSSPTLGERDVLRHCARALPDVMVPKSVEFRDELPKTASGKVARRLVA